MGMKFAAARPPIQLLIFDLDGTLIDSKLDLALSVNATLAHLGRAPLDEEAIFSYVGQGAPTLIRGVVGDTAALASRLARAERDARFYARLLRCCARIAYRLTPARERLAWRRLLSELGAG